jgi:hypothetical protein
VPRTLFNGMTTATHCNDMIQHISCRHSQQVAQRMAGRPTHGRAVKDHGTSMSFREHFCRLRMVRSVCAPNAAKIRVGDDGRGHAQAERRPPQTTKASSSAWVGTPFVGSRQASTRAFTSLHKRATSSLQQQPVPSAGDFSGPLGAMGESIGVPAL